MYILPETDNSLLIRADFSASSKWAAICTEVKRVERSIEMFLEFVEDSQFNNLQIEQLPKFGVNQNQQQFIFLADELTSTGREFLINCIDLSEEFGRSFRVVPTEILNILAGITTNANFADFADRTDKDGIYRGI